MSEINEALLIIQLKAGYDRAVRDWFVAYSPVVRQFVAKRVSTESDVEELVQEIFLACLRSLVHFRGQSSLQTWMLTIARHTIADFYRARYAKKVIHMVALFEELSLPNTSNPTEQTQAVQSTLLQLPPLWRELLLAKYVDGKSVKQLSSELAKTTKAIESLLFRARQEFKFHYQLALSQRQ